MCTVEAWKKRIELVAMLVAVVVGSCAPPPPAPTQTPLPPTTTPPPTVTNTPFVPKATFKIASQSPGYTAIWSGAELATEELEGPLNELGYALDFRGYDDKDDLNVAVANARSIIADPEVLCVVGPYTSRVTRGVMDLYHVAGLAFISPSASNPNVTDSHYLEVNRLSARDDGVGIAAARFFSERGLANVFLIRNNDDYGNRTANSFKGEAGKLGLTVLGDTAASVEMANHAAVIDKALPATPDVIYYAGTADQAGAFFREVRLAGYSGVLLAADSATVLGERAGPLATEGGGTFYVSEVAPSGSLPGAEAFVEHYRYMFRELPGWHGAEAYDAAGMCLKAIESASKAKGGELPTRQEVAIALRALSGYQGITGTIDLDENGERSPAPYYVVQMTSTDPQTWMQNPIVDTIWLPPQD